MIDYPKLSKVKMMNKYKTSLDNKIEETERQLQRMKQQKTALTEKIDKLESPTCKCGSQNFQIKIDPSLTKYNIWHGRTIYLVCTNCWEVYKIEEPGATN